MRSNIERARWTWIAVLAMGAAAAAASGCKGDKGGRGTAGPDGPAGGVIETLLEPFAPLPGLNIAILSVDGATGRGGAFQVGNRLSVTFTVTLDDGTPVPLDQIDFAGIFVSGPTVNYQRVFPEQFDLLTASVENRDGSYTYTFTSRIPETYAAPVNDTTAFDEDDGELQGEDLQSGTYTVGMEAYKSYTIEGTDYRDAANATEDFLFGRATEINPREVVAQANCNRCHDELRAHGDIRRDVRLCVLCHTSGAEDKNEPTVEGGTPGVSVDFRVMIHRIHDGEHLPSVLGVDTNVDGSRTYAATPEPYVIVGYANSVHDFSEVAFPAWPNLNIAMPRDQGYSLLTSAQQATDATIRTGVTACALCHGDPDGSGPLDAPAQGDVYEAQPTRRACGSCHDDIHWDQVYVSNYGPTGMPAQLDDSSCQVCHAPGTARLGVAIAHTHPLYDPAVNPGLNFDLIDVDEAGTNNNDGTFDPGEKIELEFTITDDSGAAVAGSSLNSVSVVISGPIENRNLLLSGSIPAAALGAGPDYVTNVPESIVYERLGVVPAGLTLNTSRTPIWTAATTSVWERGAKAGGSSTLVTGSVDLQRYVDLASITGFAYNDYVVIADGQPTEEYVRVALVDGTRLWFNAPLRYDHTAGTTVEELTLTTRSTPADWTITSAASGLITFSGAFAAGDVAIISYTTDYIVPSVYQPPFNDSPDIDETWGDWVGLPILDGTYQLGLWGYRNILAYGETYRGTSPPEVVDILVGAATETTPYTLIASADGCNRCHVEPWFHGGGRRGFDTCILCHGVAGAEDRPRYVAGNAGATTGVLIDFRQMLHRIHRGADLENAETYTVNGYSSAAYPANFTPYTYGEIEFPGMPGGVAECDMCHGEGNESYTLPTPRQHLLQSTPTRPWRTACTSCHDGDSTVGHADVMTDLGGIESCGVCHGPGEEYEVELMHWIR